MLKNILPIAAAGALSLFAATGFASADDSHATNLGPVGPYQPILANGVVIDAKAMTILNKGEVLTRQASNVVY